MLSVHFFNAKPGMKIALLGSRGIPARYSGFETFYEQLGVRLAQRGHQVTVYNRRHFLPDVRGSYRGVRIISTGGIATKHLDTITHTLLASLHAVGERYDIAYYCIVGNAPLVWLPRLVGSRTLLNVDGEDWAREKWSCFARWYQRRCERLAGRLAHVLIADARVVQERYAREYGMPSIFVPYGALIRKTPEMDALRKWGLTPNDYILYVGRLVPENAVDLLLRAYRKVRTSKKLVIVGSATYEEHYSRRLRELADARVVFTGWAFGQDYAQLSSHAYLYVQPSAVNGTRPALLDQLGFGNCVLVRATPANLEVIGDCGESFSNTAPEESLRASLEKLLANPDRVEHYRKKAASRIANFYNWEWICDFYEELFQRLVNRQPPRNYDEFLAATGRGEAALPVPPATSPNQEAGAPPQ